MLSVSERGRDGLNALHLRSGRLPQAGRADEAVVHLERALQAPPRPGRQIADTGRREEVRALLGKLKPH